jgi:hypothetical protein
MRDIYASAAGVIVSLGEQSPEIDPALMLARNLAEAYAKCCKDSAHERQNKYHQYESGAKYHISHVPLDIRKEMNQISEGSSEMMIDFLDTAAWSTLRDLFQRPWFTRAWVLQEVVFSKQCNLICGTKTISWDVLTSACSYLRECVGSSSLQEDIKGADYMTVLSASLRAFGDQEHRSPLVEALTAARSLQATDPRDKIYSVLGIISSKSDSGVVTYETPIHSNYAETVNNVFTEVARAAILQTQTLEMLSHVGRAPEQTVGGLPTWVPDWRHEIPCLVLGRLDSHNSFHFDASGYERRRYEAVAFRNRYAGRMSSSDQIDPSNLPLPPLFSIPVNPSHLHLRGISIDTITALSSDLFICDIYEQHHISDTNNPVYKSFWEALNSFLRDNEVRYTNDDPRICRLEGNFFDEHLSNPPFELVQDYYLRTVCANLDISDFFQPGGQGWYYRLSSIQPSYRCTRGGTIWKNVNTILEPPSRALMQRMRTKRCLIATERGYLGIAPSWAKEGDEICVLFGGSVPLIIRERGGGEGVHELVGECYVHGIMNGEAVDIEKMEHVEQRDFILV